MIESPRIEQGWDELLEALWAKCKTAAACSKEGFELDREDKSMVVRHNRIGKDALLRISDSKARSLRLVYLAGAYRKGGTSASKRYLKPDISDSPKVAFEAEGEATDGKLSIDARGKSSEQLHELISGLSSVCDRVHDVSVFRIRWDGRLAELLPYSIVNGTYRKIVVDGTGALMLLNFKEVAKGKSSPENAERELGIGIQKAILQERYPERSFDLEDIMIQFADPGLRRLAESVIASGDPEDQKVRLEGLFETYSGVHGQVRSCRSGVAHLVPIQMNERIAIVIGGEDKYGARAFYDIRGSERGSSRYLPKTESCYHSSLSFPQGGYQVDEKGGRVSISQDALVSEMRHHVHAQNEQLIGNGVDGGMSLGRLATMEMVDEMKDFGKIAGNVGNAKITDIISLGNRFRKVMQTRRGIWDVLNVFSLDLDLKGYGDGHPYVKYPLTAMADWLGQAGAAASAVDRVDKSVFDFLSGIQWEKMKSLRSLINRTNRYRRLVELDAPRELIGWESELIVSALRKGANLENFLIEFDWFNGSYNDLKGKVEKNPIYKGRRKIDEAQAAQLEADWMQAQALLGFMQEYIPFVSEEGKRYPTPISYYLNPLVLSQKARNGLSGKGKEPEKGSEVGMPQSK